MEQRTKQLRLFEAETRLRKTLDRLNELNEIHGPSNIVRVEIPMIGHLISPEKPF